MRIAVPREVKEQEFRVALTPAGAGELAGRGHQVLVEAGAGVGSGFTDAEYRVAGAVLVPDAETVWREGELVLKVKEPVAEEYPRMRDGQVLFTFLHLAASRECTEAILDAGVTAVAYEAVRTPNGALPLLAPMSEVAGKLAPQVGAYHLMAPFGGSGVLLGGVPGVRRADVVVLGGGVAGTNAAAVAAGMGARVSVLDTNPVRLRELEARFHGRITTLASNATDIEHAVTAADLVIGSVLVPGARAPKLVSDELVARMRTGSVLVDVAIDQGGCFAGSRPTTHADPTFRVAGSVFYCVPNMPGAVPHTATVALTNATLPYVRQIAAEGWAAAAAADPALARGLTAADGKLCSAEVAAAHGYPPPVTG
ncbi:alanine dehydrogenase [Nocardia donostiensis]|uniref:Alanine dehydrogenase n=1 Tax=Nocardia donostiensis TaxID=1538463 RepID=A0A1V2TGQ2_9NOCA|nr:alanine dehydrogenase [Nocardia donostiensis]ONM48643.1 alanine dehydrogenase [Nocardia donostiensis]OQS16832.1 alanine dehydrogenase [Nocardia donostiensis]OQS23297.1 alanine dehydrogenase [Nocardia donostiensis]